MRGLGPRPDFWSLSLTNICKTFSTVNNCGRTRFLYTIWQQSKIVSSVKKSKGYFDKIEKLIFPIPKLFVSLYLPFAVTSLNTVLIYKFGDKYQFCCCLNVVWFFRQDTGLIAIEGSLVLNLEEKKAQLMTLMHQSIWTRLNILMFCAIWYHLQNLKNVKNTHGVVFLLVKLQDFRYCTNSAKPCNAS